MSRQAQSPAIFAQQPRRLVILVRGVVFSCPAIWHGLLRESWISAHFSLLCSDHSLCRLSCIPTLKATTLTPLISATNSTKCVRVLYLRRNSHRLSLQFVIPEYAAHGFIAVLFLLTGNWTAFLWNVPLLAWNINKCVDQLAEFFSFPDQNPQSCEQEPHV